MLSKSRTANIGVAAALLSIAFLLNFNVSEDLILRRSRSGSLSDPYYSDTDIEFRQLYVLKNGSLYDGFGNELYAKGEFQINFATGEIIGLWGGSAVRTQWYGYLVDEQGELWQGSRRVRVDSEGRVWQIAEERDSATGQTKWYGYFYNMVADGRSERTRAELSVDKEGCLWHGDSRLEPVQFIGAKGHIVFDRQSNQPLVVDSRIVRGGYHGVNYQRSADTPLFDIMPSEAETARLRELIVGEGRDPIGVVIDLDTDPPGDYVEFARIMAANPDIAILLPFLDIDTPGSSGYFRNEEVARRALAALLQAEWAVFGGQDAGKYLMRINDCTEMQLGAAIEDIRSGEWESGDEAVHPGSRSEDLHETAAARDAIQGAYNLDSSEFENGRIPDQHPVVVYRQVYLTSEKELDIESLFRPYTDNYLDDEGNIQDNLVLVFIDDTENVELREQFRRAIDARARDLGVSDKVFYFHRLKDPSWRGIEEGYMRKIGRVIWLSYFLQTGRNQGPMYTDARYDGRARDGQGRIPLNSTGIYVQDGRLYYNGTVLERRQ